MTENTGLVGISKGLCPPLVILGCYEVAMSLQNCSQSGKSSRRQAKERFVQASIFLRNLSVFENVSSRYICGRNLERVTGCDWCRSNCPTWQKAFTGATDGTLKCQCRYLCHMQWRGGRTLWSTQSTPSDLHFRSGFKTPHGRFFSHEAQSSTCKGLGYKNPQQLLFLLAVYPSRQSCCWAALFRCWLRILKVPELRLAGQHAPASCDALCNDYQCQKRCGACYNPITWGWWQFFPTTHLKAGV